MSTSRSMFFTPAILLYFPGFSELWFSFWAKARFKIVLTNVDFPEPETPVTTTNSPNGKSTVMSFRLFSAAPVSRIDLPLPVRRSSGTGMYFLPERYWPVKDFRDRITCFGVPAAITWPPFSPAPGPISTM